MFLFLFGADIFGRFLQEARGGEMCLILCCFGLCIGTLHLYASMDFNCDSNEPRFVCIAGLLIIVCL